MVCSGAWVNRTLGQLIRTVVDRSAPGGTGLDIRSKPDPSPVLILSPTISPDFGLSDSFQVGKKLQSTSLDEVRNAQKLDTTVDRKFPNDRDSASVFSKVIIRELSHGSSN